MIASGGVFASEPLINVEVVPMMTFPGPVQDAAWPPYANPALSPYNQPLRAPTVSVMPPQTVDWWPTAQPTRQSIVTGSDRLSLQAQPEVPSSQAAQVPRPERDPRAMNEMRDVTVQLDAQKDRIERLTREVETLRERSVSGRPFATPASFRRQWDGFAEFMQTKRAGLATFTALTALSLVFAPSAVTYMTLGLGNVLFAGIATLLLRTATRLVPPGE